MGEDVGLLRGLPTPEAQVLRDALNAADPFGLSESQRVILSSLRQRLGALLDALGDAQFAYFTVPDSPELALWVSSVLNERLDEPSLHTQVLAGIAADRAARNGQPLALRACLLWVSAQWENARGSSLLHHAIESGNFECMDLLLRAQSPLDALQPNRSGDSAISLAARSTPAIFTRVFLALTPAVRGFVGPRPPMGRRVWFRLAENPTTLDAIDRMAWEHPGGKLASRLLKLAPLDLFPRLRAVRERQALEHHLTRPPASDSSCDIEADCQRRARHRHENDGLPPERGAQRL